MKIPYNTNVYAFYSIWVQWGDNDYCTVISWVKSKCVLFKKKQFQFILNDRNLSEHVQFMNQSYGIPIFFDHKSNKKLHIHEHRKEGEFSAKEVDLPINRRRKNKQLIEFSKVFGQISPTSLKVQKYAKIFVDTIK